MTSPSPTASSTSGGDSRSVLGVGLGLGLLRGGPGGNSGIVSNGLGASHASTWCCSAARSPPSPHRVARDASQMLLGCRWQPSGDVRLPLCEISDRPNSACGGTINPPISALHWGQGLVAFHWPCPSRRDGREAVALIVGPGDAKPSVIGGVGQGDCRDGSCFQTNCKLATKWANGQNSCQWGMACGPCAFNVTTVSMIQVSRRGNTGRRHVSRRDR